MSTQQPAKVFNDGSGILIEIDGYPMPLTPQQAYDLHQAIGQVLPELVQPFKPWPREDEL
jgi:hypothetical protein